MLVCFEKWVFAIGKRDMVHCNTVYSLQAIPELSFYCFYNHSSDSFETL